MIAFFGSEDGRSRFLQNIDHGFTSQKMVFFIVTAIRISNLPRF
jgi:hypothetical protein